MRWYSEVPLSTHLIPSKAAAYLQLDVIDPLVSSLNISDLATFGLPEGWVPIFDWAHRNQVLPELVLGIDVLRLGRFPNRFRVLLENLLTPEAHEMLGPWGEQNSMANRLRILSMAAQLDPEVFSNSPPITRGVSARNQLRGELQESYLYALLVEHIDARSPEERSWLITFRLWLLVMAFHHGQDGNVQDAHMRQLAAGIRLACEPRLEWAHLAAEFLIETTNVDELTSFLNFRAYQLQQHKKDLGAEQKKFLRALIQLTEGKTSPEQSASFQPLLAQVRSKWNLEIPKQSTLQQNTELLISESSGLIVTGSNGLDAVGVGGCDPLKSYAQQLLSTKSVYLLNAEELHFLPWSWNKPNPAEQKALDRWVNTLLVTPHSTLKLLGAYVWIARATGRSLQRVLEVGFSDEAKVDWQINLSASVLHRLPPARHNGWKPSPQDEPWVVPLADPNQIHLPKKVSTVLEPLIQERAPQQLGWLWQDEQSPSARFLAELPTEISRLTPGMLGQALPQRVFEQTGDGAFSRVVASGPQVGLPGACAYGNWSQDTVHLLLNQDSFPVPIKNEGNRIAAGSRLDPLESKLVEAIGLATQLLHQRQSGGDWQRFHNEYVSWLTVSLLAATGARPVRDPFESIRHFDLEECFVYIDEKSSGAARAGRVVPLPMAVVNQVKQYRQYLKRLASRFRNEHLSLGDEIANAASGEAAAMPFLFLLRSGDGGLDWESVSEGSIMATELFQWPLPLNLFRHRMAQQLRRRAIDPEIIDGLLGHAEYGCMTYGDDSTRTWRNDMSAVRPTIEAIYSELQFGEVKPISLESGLDGLKEKKSRSARVYGAAARQANREQTIRRAEEQANHLIKQFLGKRSLIDLSEDEVWELSKKLMLSSSGMPIPTGYVRYSVLTKRFEEEWAGAGKRIRVRRRFLRLKPPASQFTSQAPGVLAWHAKALKTVEEKLDEFGAAACDFNERCLIATLLCFEVRLAAPAILVDVACGINYRITLLAGKYDLEYVAHAELSDPDATVERFPITSRLARLLSLAKLPDSRTRTELSQATDKRMNKVSSLLAKLIRKEMEPVNERLTVEDFFKILARKVDQVNALTLPGVVVAWLGGRVQSASLSWRDRIRLEKGYIPAISRRCEATPEESSEDDVQIVRSLTIDTPEVDGESEELQRAARGFFRELRRLLPNENELNTRLVPERRRDLGNQVGKLIREHAGKASPAVLLVGQWIKELILGKVAGHGQLKLSTIGRYLAALSPMFESSAYALNLMLLDDEEMTELYATMLGAINHVEPTYTAARLAEFQRWATLHGVENPDWSQMPYMAKSRGISPGLIQEGEYQQVLSIILHSKDIEAGERQAAAFLLLCSYRFGLRGGEALGLRRDDWCKTKEGQYFVIVRSHPWRSLKSDAARRVVPLLFKLSEDEISVIREMMTRYASLHGKDHGFPLFGKSAEKKTLKDAAALKRIAISVLKQVTGNPSINLHHARHSAANRLAIQFIGLQESTLHKAGYKGEECFELTEAEGILLGRCGFSRRQSWALARYLGHAGTRTLWNSYLHVLPEWTRECLGLRAASPDDPEEDIGIIRLDQVAQMAVLETSLLDKAPFEAKEFTLSSALQFLRLIGSGKSTDAAASALAIRMESAESLYEAATKIGGRLRLSADSEGKERNNKDNLGFLRRYPEATWARMIDFAREVRTTSDQKVDGGNCLATVVESVGPTGQFIMWDPRHFVFIRAFIKLFGINDDEFLVVRTNRWHEQLEELCKQNGFEVKTHKEIAKKVQIDTVMPVSIVADVVRRAALIYQENNSRLMRSRLDFILLLLAFASSQAEI